MTRVYNAEVLFFNQNVQCTSSDKAVFVMTLHLVVKYTSLKVHAKFDTLVIAGIRNQECKARYSHSNILPVSSIRLSGVFRMWEGGRGLGPYPSEVQRQSPGRGSGGRRGRSLQKRKLSWCNRCPNFYVLEEQESRAAARKPRDAASVLFR